MRPLALLFTCLALFGAVGCGGDDDNDNAATPATQADAGETSTSTSTSTTDTGKTETKTTDPEAVDESGEYIEKEERKPKGPSTKTFLRRASAVCRKTRTELKKTNAKARKATSIPAAGRALMEQAEAYIAGTKRLAALKVPEGGEGEMQMYLDAREGVGEAQRDAANGLLTNKRDEAQKALERAKTGSRTADKLARNIGLTSCLTPRASV